MKKLILITMTACLFAACSDKDKTAYLKNKEIFMSKMSAKEKTRFEAAFNQATIDKNYTQKNQRILELIKQRKKEEKEVAERRKNFTKQWRVKPGSFERSEELRKKLFERMNKTRQEQRKKDLKRAREYRKKKEAEKTTP